MNHWIHLQAQLLKSRALRDSCRNHPENLPWPHPPTPTDLHWFQALSWNQLEKQANGLLRKRLHEVSRLLPKTQTNLQEAFSKTFLDYAETHWPSTHRRHWIDAAQFLLSLKPQYLPHLDPIEALWIPFVANNRRFQIHLWHPLKSPSTRFFGLILLWRIQDTSRYRYWISSPRNS